MQFKLQNQKLKHSSWFNVDQSRVKAQDSQITFIHNHKDSQNNPRSHHLQLLQDLQVQDHLN